MSGTIHGMVYVREDEGISSDTITSNSTEAFYRGRHLIGGIHIYPTKDISINMEAYDGCETNYSIQDEENSARLGYIMFRVGPMEVLY